MSYVVDVGSRYSDRPKWFINAWRDAFKREDLRDPRRAGRRSWFRLYPDYVHTWGGDHAPTTVTFPDEQTYIWFVLKWS